MNTKPRILVCDDDGNIAELLRLSLDNAGYEVTLAENGTEALRLFSECNPDLVLLDVMMPEPDGLQVLRTLRTMSPCPVIMLTARGETFDKVLALELGADDYVVKPFDSKELLARIRAVLRRFENDRKEREPEPELPAVITFDKLYINRTNYELRLDGRTVSLPPKELELLYHLANNPGKVYTRNQLLDQVWGFDYGGDSRTVDVHIKRLREKLEGISDEWALSTVWKVGYKFEILA